MRTKTVYQCDEDGVLLGPTEAFESPLEPGVFPLPAGCVAEEPPSEDGKIAVWSGDSWSLVTDCRGEVWYSEGLPVTVDFVGSPAERGLSPTPPLAPPAPPPDLTARQLRLGLLEIGIKPSDVTAAIEQLPSPDKERAEIEWEYANTFQRDHPLITVLANHFGLSKEAVDKAWLASTAL